MYEFVVEGTSRRKVSDLTPHPLNKLLYGEDLDPDFVKSIDEQGILTPLLILSSNVIVSGHRRWLAAKQLGVETVPITIFSETDELTIEEALIEANRQRTKDAEILGREGIRLGEIYHDRESRQGARNDVVEDTNDNTSTTSREFSHEVRPIDKAAEKLGVNTSTMQHAIKAVKEMDKAEAEGNTERATEIKQGLNKSVNAGYVAAKSNGKAKKAKEPREPKAIACATCQFYLPDKVSKQFYCLGMTQIFPIDKDKIPCGGGDYNKADKYLCAHCGHSLK